MATYSLDHVLSVLNKIDINVEHRKIDIWLYRNDKLLRTFLIEYDREKRALIDARDFDNWLFYMGYT